MPAELPTATAEQRALAEREQGYDTEVARFFGVDVLRPDEVPTLIHSSDLGREARERSSRRANEKPVRMR